MAGWPKPGHGATQDVCATRDKASEKHLGPAVADLRRVPRSSPAAAGRADVQITDLLDLLGLATLMLIAAAQTQAT